MYEKCILQLLAKGLLIVECRLSTVGCWLSVVHCCWLLIVVCRLSGVGCWLSVVVVVDYCWLPTVACRLSGVGCWSSVVVVVGYVWLPTCRASAVGVVRWLSGSVVDENFDCRCPALPLTPHRGAKVASIWGNGVGAFFAVFCHIYTRQPLTGVQK